MSDWKPELDAIVGARHGGRVDHLVDLLGKLDARYPNVAEISYQLAWTLEAHGKLTAAIPHYEKAIALGLSPNEHSGALIGLGNTLRGLGLPERAIKVLRSGQVQFPDNREFDAFLALALHDVGQATEAIRLLLTLIADTSDDPGLTAYQRAIRHAASRLS